MRNLGLLSFPFAVVLMICAASNAMAQRYQPFGAIGVEDDYQIFAPAELGSYGEPPDPNVGYYATYNRLHWNVSRAESSNQPNEGDWTWGNRYDVGYMTNDDHGWSASSIRLSGDTDSRAIVATSRASWSTRSAPRGAALSKS